MKINAGDKVKFLNEKGEGIVTRVKGSIVFVEIEEGFELPFELNQVVRIELGKAEIQKSEEEKNIAEDEEIFDEAEEEDEIEDDFGNINPPLNTEGIYLAFEAESSKNPLQSDLILGLINNTSYSIYFICSVKKQNNYSILQTGFINTNEQLELKKISRNDLENYSTIRTEIIFFKEEPYFPLPPVTETIRLKAVKFYKDSAYVSNPFTKNRAHLIPVYIKKEMVFIPPSADSLKKILQQKERSEKGKISRPNASQIEVEIDLHIEELIEDIRGLTNAAIIGIQLNHFRSALESAISNGVKRLIVIHGIGNGRLREEVRKVVKTYDGISCRDGSYARYGFGATEVLIH
jgi:hypothetical protein